MSAGGEKVRGEGGEGEADCADDHGGGSKPGSAVESGGGSGFGRGADLARRRRIERPLLGEDGRDAPGLAVGDAPAVGHAEVAPDLAQQGIAGGGA